MSAPAVAKPLGREAFVRETLAWVNRRFAPAGPPVGADTPLFAGGLVNSLGILELIAWTERAAGRRIPDVEIRMDNFRTVARIAEVFVKEER
jgi:acyl carrier protein